MMRTAGNAGAVGIEIALAICLGYFGGEYLDGKFNSTPWLKWIGFAAGVGAAIKALMRVTRQYKKALAKEEGSAGSDKPK
jgi:F0F1-type ATP synthase assembly protein I